MNARLNEKRKKWSMKVSTVTREKGWTIMVSLRGHRNGAKTRRSSVGKSLKHADWSIHSKLNINSSHDELLRLFKVRFIQFLVDTSLIVL